MVNNNDGLKLSPEVEALLESLAPKPGGVSAAPAAPVLSAPTAPVNDEESVVSVRAVMNAVRRGTAVILAVTMIFTALGAAASFFYYFTRPYSGTSTMLFSYGYRGVENGVDPLGRPLDVSKIKSPLIIDKAIEQLDLYKKNITVEDVRSNLVIQGVIPDDIMQEILIISEIATKTPAKLEDLSELQYHPTQYIVRLRRNHRLSSLTVQEMNDLLSAVMQNYREFFIDEYSNRNMLDSVIENFEQSEYDYFEVMQILGSQANNMINYCELMRSTAPDFRSPATGMTFGEILANIRLVNTVDIHRVSALVYSGGISRDRAQMERVFEYNIYRAIMERDVSLAKADNALELAQMYEKDFFVISHLPEQDSYSQASIVYDGFLKEALKLQEKAEELTAEAQFYTDNLNMLRRNTNPENANEVRIVEESIPVILSALRQWGDITIQTAEDYLELEVFKDATKVVTPSHFKGTFSEHNRTMIIICASGVMLGFFISILMVIWKDAFRGGHM